jgi:two-component system sensor histidine kinase CpxA
MRSLFAKLFFGAATIILLSMVITIAIAVFSSFGPVKMHRKHIHQREQMLIYDVLGLYGHDALNALIDNGPDAIERLDAGLETQTNFQSFLFTTDAVQITGKPAPTEVISLVKRLSGTTPDGIVRDSLMIIAARTMKGKNGKKYVVAAILPHPSDDPFEKRFPFPRDFWLRILVSFLLCGTICYALARHLTIPLDKLQTATRKLAEGDLSVRVSPSMGNRSDEIAALGKDFDRMAEKIENLVDSQKRLIRDISHELRSPLSRLTVALELARQRGTEAVIPPLDRIGLETERLNDMIGQLLTLTKLESETQRKTEDMDVCQIIQSIATDARFEAQLRNVQVKTDIPESLPFQGHPEMLYRAIENIVRNALRYTADETTVSITAARAGIENSWLDITVKDQGPGVPDSELPHLFKPFYRIEDSRDRSRGGTGIGLAIAERAVKLHHGTLSVENDEGQGLMVRILLPIDLS